MEIVFNRISPDLVRKENWRRYLGASFVPGEEGFFFSADTFYDPNYNVFGVAYSNHEYDAYPLGQRDVQLAFETIQTAISTYKPTTQAIISTFLQNSLLMIAQAFAELKVSAEDYHAIPQVCIALVVLRGKHLSAAIIGNISLYIIHPDSSKQIIGLNSSPDLLTSHLISSEIKLHQITLKPGSLIVAATDSLWEVIGETEFSKFSGLGVCQAEAANKLLIDTMKSQPGGLDDPSWSPETDRSTGQSTDRYILGYGAAWAIACVEQATK